MLARPRALPGHLPAPRQPRRGVGLCDVEAPTLALDAPAIGVWCLSALGLTAVIHPDCGKSLGKDNQVGGNLAASGYGIDGELV